MATKAFEHHAYAVRAAKDGTLGYSDGKKYVPIYGRLQHVSDDATSVKVTSSQHIDTSIGISVGMEGPSMDLSGNRRRTREETFFMENALFKYERASGSEVVYVQEAWKRGYAVRRLLANALTGLGAMLASNQDRVYVLDSSIPHEHEMVRRGYLQVDGADMVEHFLRGMRWASRCEGFMPRRTKTGEYVKTFVIKDRTLEPDTVGYYVVCTKASVPGRFICHLEPIGRFLDSMRPLVGHTGESELGPWALRTHGAQSFLFD